MSHKRFFFENPFRYILRGRGFRVVAKFVEYRPLDPPDSSKPPILPPQGRPRDSVLAALRIAAIHLFACPFVCRQNAYTETRFSQKLSTFRAMVSIEDLHGLFNELSPGSFHVVSDTLV